MRKKVGRKLEGPREVGGEAHFLGKREGGGKGSRGRRGSPTAPKGNGVVEGRGRMDRKMEWQDER